MTKRELRKMILPLAVLVICGLFVFFERFGVVLLDHEDKDNTELTFTDAVESAPECLVIYDETNEISVENYEMMEVVLDGMKVNHVACQPEEFDGEQLKDYRTVVLAIDDWSLLEEKIFDITAWVKEGGAMMNTMTPQPNGTFQAVSGWLGILNGGTSYTGIRGITILAESMIGADEDTIFILSEEEMDISLAVGLQEDAQIYITCEDKEVPLLWSMEYGAGRFVILNEAFMDKYQRGIFSTAYSLMEDVCIYPVINGSAYYLDDFPAPVPEGEGEYIERDYGVDIYTFYSIIWWPKVLSWQEKYGIKYTGVVIELYSEQVEGEFPRNELPAQFETYGNMLLNSGGEIGFHGYNHMPLCVAGIDDERQFADYKLWPSKNEIIKAMLELKAFCSNLFPTETFKVYVPPSNIISDAGIEALTTACPDINVIAGTYLTDTDSNVYEQEFEVDKYGIIHTPRVISGCVFNDYSRLNALTELNFHFVQNHFTHPDDVLDEERGAALGWETLSANWEEYIQWVCDSVPMMRNMTGSELGEAVLQYCNISVDREVTDNAVHVKLGGFSGEAYFLMRLNQGEVTDTVNCEIEHVTGDLYLIHATKEEIQILTK